MERFFTFFPEVDISENSQFLREHLVEPDFGLPRWVSSTSSESGCYRESRDSSVRLNQDQVAKEWLGENRVRKLEIPYKRERLYSKELERVDPRSKAPEHVKKDRDGDLETRFASSTAMASLCQLPGSCVEPLGASFSVRESCELLRAVLGRRCPCEYDGEQLG